MEVLIGRLYQRCRLLPVGQSKTQNTILSKIERKTTKWDDMILVLRSPDGKEVVFLDENGKQALVETKDLGNEITFINANFKRVTVHEWVLKKMLPFSYEKMVNDFYNKAETKKRYKGWEGLEVEEMLDESAKLKVNGMYQSVDGDWTFVVKKKTKDGYRVLDLEDGKEFNVDLADIELTKPKFVEMVR